jgi:hypothetical protein
MEAVETTEVRGMGYGWVLLDRQLVAHFLNVE